MPRAPNEKIRMAFELYRQEVPLQEIAEKLNIPAGTVRRWKSTHRWDTEQPEAETDPDESQKAQGAQRGNRNAVGNQGGPGAPERNTYAEKHGAYSKIYFDTLDEDELELMGSVDLNEEQILLQQIRDLTVKARRLKRHIKAAEGKRGDLLLSGVVKEHTPAGEKTTTITASAFDQVIKLEAELDKTQGRITKATDTLIRYRDEQARLALEEKRLQLMKTKALGILDADDLEIGGPGGE